MNGGEYFILCEWKWNVLIQDLRVKINKKNQITSISTGECFIWHKQWTVFEVMLFVNTVICTIDVDAPKIANVCVFVFCVMEESHVNVNIKNEKILWKNPPCVSPAVLNRQEKTIIRR